VLREYQLEPLPIHLIYLSHRLIQAKVRVVSDFLADELGTSKNRVFLGKERGI